MYLVNHQNLLRMMYRGVNKFKINVKFLDWFNRTVMATYKTSFLFNVGFLFRNLIDTNLKNFMVAGKVSEIPGVLLDEYKAAKMLMFHEEVQREAIKLFGNVNSDNIVYVLKKYPKEMRQAYIFTEVFRKSPASSGLSDSVKKMLENYYIDESDDVMEKIIRKYDDAILNFKPIQAVQHTQDTIEQVARLGLTLHEFKKTGNMGKAINLAIDTHFDYSTKSLGLMYGELIIPFLTFPLRNLAFYGEHTFDNPRLMVNLAHAFTQSWKDEDEYRSMSSPSKFIQNLVTQGDMKFGDYVLKTNTSLFDALGLIVEPDQILRQRVAPPIKAIMNINNPDFNQFTNLVPFSYNIQRLANSAKEINKGNVNIATLAPSFALKLKDFKYTPKEFKKSQVYLRHINPYKKYTYRPRTYYSKSRRRYVPNMFNKIYKKLYTLI